MSIATHAGHVPGLDGVRGLAALAVFGVHFNQIVRAEYTAGPFDLARWLANGEYGVALFFLLSGFLLGLPYWRAIDAGAPAPAWRDYALRRLARIVPAYYVALTLLIVVSGAWRQPGATVDIALHVLFLFNFAEFSITSINAPFWTLAVEMQFYLLLPFIFLLVARVPAAWRVGLLLALGGSSYAAHVGLQQALDTTLHWPGLPWLVWLRPYGAVVSQSLLAHLPHFLLGVIAGWVYLRLAATLRTAPWADAVVVIACGLVFVLLATPLGDAVAIPGGRYGLPVLPVLLALLLICIPLSVRARRVLETPPLRGLGAISYGVYIYHLPALLLVDRYLMQYGIDAAERYVLFGLVAMALTLVVAGLSYGLVERPVMRRVRRRGMVHSGAG